MHAPDETLVEVRPGLRLHTLRWPGPGVPYLLVHGLASNARLWAAVAARLWSAGHTVVAVDLRGHGRSDRPDGPYDTPTVADDLALLIELLGLDRPVTAGQSWGGNVVLDLAARHVDAVRSLGLVDGGWIHLRDRYPDWDRCATELAPPGLAGLAADRMRAVLGAAHPGWSGAAIDATMASFEHLDDGTIRPSLTFERHLAVLKGLWEHEPRLLYPNVTVPVLLLPAGFSSAGVQRAAVDEALCSLPDARVRWFDGADHDVHAQHPAEVAAELGTLA